MTHRRSAAVALLAACVLVPVTASASASDDAHVTWEQVRTALAAAHHPAHQPADQPAGQPAHQPAQPGRGAPVQPVVPGPPTPKNPPDPPAAGATPVTVTVTIPDLSWALDDPEAPAGVRRAACHQATGLDDETAAPLAACLAYVRGGPPTMLSTP